MGEEGASQASFLVRRSNQSSIKKQSKSMSLVPLRDSGSIDDKYMMTRKIRLYSPMLSILALIALSTGNNGNAQVAANLFFPKCGKYRVSGVVSCKSYRACSVNLNPGTLSALSIPVHWSKKLLELDGLWTSCDLVIISTKGSTVQAKIESQSLRPSSPGLGDEPTVTLKREGACQ